MAKYTLAVPDELDAALRAEHRRTFDAHGLHFQTWLRAMLEKSIGFKAPKKRAKR